MAVNTDFVRIASAATRPLPETVLDSIRDAVVVIDTRPKHLPVVLANATARRCITGDPSVYSLEDGSLYSLLRDADGVIQEALELHAKGGGASNQLLEWSFARGRASIPTEVKVVSGAVGQRMVMLTFAELLPEPMDVSAVDHSVPALLMMNKELTVTYANASAVRAAGGQPGGILGMSGLALVPTLAIPRDAFSNALDGISFRDDSIAVMVPGAPTRWFEVDVQPLKDSEGVAGLAVLSNEVTERRVGRGTQTAGERRVLAHKENARDIITVAGDDGEVLSISAGIRVSLGYTVEERRSHSIFEHIHPDDVDNVRSKYMQLAGGGLSTFSHQFRVRHKNGSYRWLESNYVSTRTNPLVKGVVITSRDITERRQAENQLAQREEVFRLAADAVNGVIFEWDLVRETVHRSRGVKEVLGLDAEDLVPEGAWTALIHPLDVDSHNQVTEKAIREGSAWTTTYRIRDARGIYHSLLERGLIQRNHEGDPVRAIGCCVDVSEIKRLTDLLADAQHAAKMGAWEYSVATNELTWTEEMFRIFGASPTDFVLGWESMFGRCTPESRLRFDRAYREAEAIGSGFDLEIEINTLKGQRLWVRVMGRVELLDGRPSRACGSLQDIQQQKLAQIELENSTDWLKLSMHMANMHPWRWDKASDSLKFAILDGQMVHLPRVLPGLKKLMTYVHPKDRVALRDAIDRAFDTHKEIHQEFKLKSHNGRYRSLMTVFRPVFDAAGQASGLVGVSQDVTARHESEARLRRSEELLRTTTANTADTLMLLDANLRVRFLNREIYGKSMDEIIGEHVSVILPEEARDGVLSRLRQVLASGKTATYEFDEETPGEETRRFENRAVLVRDRGRGACISLTVRNITERKRLEQEILDVSSRERQTIGRDLHDGLGQELTGVALMLRALATKITKQLPEAGEQVNEIVGLVNQSIDSARALARGLLPVNQDSGGLGLALHALVDRSRDLYGFDVDFWAEVSPLVTITETSASHLYRITQEALTNAARHGHATQVSVYLLVTAMRFLLQITDNGLGLSESKRSSSGMGLKIMKYRAGMIGATFDIQPNHPVGTVVRITGEQPIVMTTLHSAHAI